MMEECPSPRQSVHWRPNATYAAEMGLAGNGKVIDGDKKHGEFDHAEGRRFS
jgi:hypothetical protein